MKSTIIFACFVSIIYADPYSGPAWPTPESRHFPKKLPVSVPVPVVGLLTQVTQNLANNLVREAQTITELQLTNKRDLQSFLRATSGPAFNIQAKIGFIKKQGDEFWEHISNMLYNITWMFKLDIAKAIFTIEKQFQLVIGQPGIRSWLRKLRDHTRIGRNQGLAVFVRNRTKWEQLFGQVVAELEHLLQSSQFCQNPEAMQNRFNHIIRQFLWESADISRNLQNELKIVTDEFIKQMFKLAKYIYEAEIAALKYFVT